MMPLSAKRKDFQTVPLVKRLCFPLFQAGRLTDEKKPFQCLGEVCSEFEACIAAIENPKSEISERQFALHTGSDGQWQ